MKKVVTKSIVLMLAFIMFLTAFAGLAEEGRAWNAPAYPAVDVLPEQPTSSMATPLRDIAGGQL